MGNLLNAVNFFGHEFDWNSQKTAIWLIVIQAILAVIAISLIIYVILRRRLKSQQAQVVAMTTAQPTTQNPEVIYVQEPNTEVARMLTGISLDLGVVQRDFVAGDDFSCEGLVVRAEYNVSPTSESIIDYTLVDEDTYTRLVKKDKAHGVYVIKPAMYTVGKKVVTVRLEGRTAAYTITVEEPKKVEEKPAESVQETAPVEQPAPVVEEKHEPVVQAEPQTIVVEKIIERPAEEKTRELMSISLNTDNVQKEYTVGDSIDHDGLVVTAHFNVEPLSEEVTDYSVLPPDMSKKGKPTVTVTYQGKTVGYQITVYPAPEVEPEPAPTVVEEQPVAAAPQEVVVEQSQPTVIVQRADPIIIEEESVTSRLRYDKSFTARLIQSEDEVKHWYTDIKNELLSFKNVHARMSWKRETFKCHKDVVAKFAYRGKLLCIFLPLKYAEYVEKYQFPVEDASDMSCYEDTPLMLRLKSGRRIKIAKQLIADVMEKFGIKRVPNHESVDYYMPYEGILELINKGLIKREIKSPEDEAVFEQDKKSVDNEQDESLELKEVAPGVYVTKKD